MAECSLCGEQKKLIKAHIVPESYYNLDHTSGVSVLLSSEPENFPKRVPIGVYDATILCADCDNQLGAHEDYVLQNLVKKDGEPEKAPVVSAKVYHNIDTRRVYSFAVGMVLKIGLSSHQAYSGVNLGRYVDLAKSHFLDDIYPPEIEVLVAEFSTPNPPLLNPTRLRMRGLNFLIFYANRFIFYVKLDKQKLPDELRSMGLEEQFVVSILRQWNDSKERDLMANIMRRSPHMSLVRDRWSKSSPQ